jgi:hypothetical protein
MRLLVLVLLLLLSLGLRRALLWRRREGARSAVCGVQQATWCWEEDSCLHPSHLLHGGGGVPLCCLAYPQAADVLIVFLQRDHGGIYYPSFMAVRVAQDTLSGSHTVGLSLDTSVPRQQDRAHSARPGTSPADATGREACSQALHAPAASQEPEGTKREAAVC